MGAGVLEPGGFAVVRLSCHIMNMFLLTGCYNTQLHTAVGVGSELIGKPKTICVERHG